MADMDSPSSDVREARLRHFSRPPVRYRHSIGSPNLSLARTNATSSLPAENVGTDGNVEYANEASYFGDKEVETFLENVICISDNEKDDDASLYQSVESLLTDAVNDFLQSEKIPKTIIVQRDVDRFWTVLLHKRQTFDVRKHILNIRFAGEAAADQGGPFREFLTTCMKLFPEANNMFFGSKSSACMTADPESIQNNQYFTLGQLAGLSIISIGRGPECLHPAIVRAMFEVENNVIEEVEDLALNATIDAIKAGNHDALLDAGICPAGRSSDELIKIFLISQIIFQKYKAIDQFRAGIATVSMKLVTRENFTHMRSFLEVQTNYMTFDKLSGVLFYPQLEELDSGSNELRRVRDAITELEMYLSGMDDRKFNFNGNVLTLEDFLLFCTGAERIPPFGFDKKIDIDFSDTNNIPSASTCGLVLHIPFVDIENKLSVALVHGGGFGTI